MSAEATAEINLSAALGGQSISIVKTWTMNLTAQNMASDTQVIGTTAEAITIPTDISASGVQAIILVNTDPTNYIEIDTSTNFNPPFSKIPAGQGLLLPTYSGSPTYYAKSNTAACKLAKGIIGS